MSERKKVLFGKTDLLVSRLCQGTAFRNMPRSDHAEGLEVLHHCIERGVNFFDSAVAYGWGGSEALLGKAIAGRREKLVVCTKIPASQPPAKFGGTGERKLFTPQFVNEQLEGSLARLATDYLDLVLLHQKDAGTPADEIVDTMNGLVKSGKVRYWGVSNHSGADVRELVRLSELDGRTPIAGTEDYYNIAGEFPLEGAARMAPLERELFPVLRQSQLGLIAFSPMDCGLLSPGRESEGSPELQELIGLIDQVAEDLETSRASICVAWVLTHQEVTAVLAGSESPDHVDQNIAGTELELPADSLALLNRASETFRERQSARKA